MENLKKAFHCKGCDSIVDTSNPFIYTPKEFVKFKIKLKGDEIIEAKKLIN